MTILYFKRSILSFALIILLISLAYGVDGTQINSFGQIHYIIIDPLGRKTGFDPATEQWLEEIPETNYGYTGTDDHEDPNAPDDYSMEFITSSDYPLIDGVHQIKVMGTGLGKYQIYFSISGDSRDISLSKIGYSKAEEIFYYQFDYKSNPDSSIVLERVANSSVDIRRDLDILFEQGLITKQGIYNSLSEKLEDAEKKYEKGEIEDAGEKLSSFFNKIAKKRGKHITEDAATILEEDTVALAKTWGVTLKIDDDDEEDENDDDDENEDEDDD